MFQFRRSARTATLFFVATLLLAVITCSSIHAQLASTIPGSSPQVEQQSSIQFGAESLHAGAVVPNNKTMVLSNGGSSPLEHQSDLFMRKIPFDDPKHVQELAQLLSSRKARNLKRVVFNKNGPEKENPNVLDSEMLGILIENGFLKQEANSSQLEVIGITSNNITDESCLILSKLIFKKDSVVKKLYLYNNNLQGSNCLRLIFNPILSSQSIDTNKMTIPPLSKIVILHNNIGDEGVKIVTQVARSIPTIRDLILKKVGLGEDGLVDFENDKITPSPFSVFMEAVEKSQMQILIINEIGLKGKDFVDPLIKLIKNNKSIRKIDLSDNRIGDSGVKSVMNALSEPISSEGGSPTYPFLSKIDLSNVGLTGDGIRAIIDAVKKNSSLKKVYIYRVEFFFEDPTIEAEVKQLGKVIKSDFIDEDVVTTSNNSGDSQEENASNEDGEVMDDQQEAQEEEEEEEDNATEEELKAHPLFSATPGQTKKDEL
ncbi:hypothetical protein C9374_008320 [Naegleria lovaniensis]|uniref:Uncharacterized protein n=1 Tax=Naegleria lovaniensis TaxID=51637 RepID=A0AA88KFB4_NAELO|nr:uncharacterized protein C9374_008320 [Naegleria lovaniensis]KAG2378177.1 hypothetical protein C9374_008320 [Naegleria lovaniensis]